MQGVKIPNVFLLFSPTAAAAAWVLAGRERVKITKKIIFLKLLFFDVVLSIIMSLSRPFDFTKDVNDSKHLWKIAVRITQLWYVQIPPKPGHLEMILMDSNDDFNRWSQSLLENKTYVMHNFNVLRNDLQFKACDHVYRMQFTASTTLKQREFPNIPELEYDFKKFSDIISGNFRSDLLIDVIGVFDKLIFSQTQSNLKKVIFNMKDFWYLPGGVISCTLWEAHAIKFLNFCNNQPSLQPLVILLTNARVKEDNYLPTVSNSWSGSKLLIDEEITNFQKYKDSFSSISISCETLTQSNTQLSQYSYLSDDDRFLYKAAVKSINEISSLTSSKDMTCVTFGTTTMFVVGRQGWYYDGCAKCTKKADVKDGPFTCKCGHFNQISIPRYKLEIKVNHEHSCGRFVFWDRQCNDLIGISAYEHKNQMLAEGEDDPNAFPLVLDELLARTLVLHVKVQSSYNQSFVIRLYEDPKLIKKVLDQIGVFEPTTSADFKVKSVCSGFLALESSVSMTADHDPEQFQVVTPAKRLSAEFDLDLLESLILRLEEIEEETFKVTRNRFPTFTKVNEGFRG
ncbi:hypothetical protein Lal_00033375 [Lupinus albus]|nr:hypothetical protein Lal_00033375 [Lupinus albus]